MPCPVAHEKMRTEVLRYVDAGRWREERGSAPMDVDSLDAVESKTSGLGRSFELTPTRQVTKVHGRMLPLDQEIKNMSYQKDS